MTRAACIAAGIFLVTLETCAARPAAADPENRLRSLFQDIGEGAVCVFAGTVTRIDTIRIDRWARGIRYRFREVVFARGGNAAREVWFERLVSTPKPVWVMEHGRRVGRSWEPIAPPPLTFERGVRYIVLADGAALDTAVVQVNQIQGVRKMAPDSSGVMVLEGTDLPGSRYLEGFRLKRESPPEPIPAGD